jgi:hypothetical protein
MPRNEWQHWRVLLVDHTGTSKKIDIGASCEVQLLARDGVWRTVAPKNLKSRSFTIPAASRADLAVRCTADSDIAVGGQRLANIHINEEGINDTVAHPFAAEDGTSKWAAQRPPYLRDLRQINKPSDDDDDVDGSGIGPTDAPVIVQERSVRTSKSSVNGPMLGFRQSLHSRMPLVSPPAHFERVYACGPWHAFWVLNRLPVDTLNSLFSPNTEGRSFNPNTPTNTATVGTVQQWKITSGNEEHPFHLHVYHVQPYSRCPGVASTGSFEGGEWYDVIDGECLVRFDLRPEFTTVFQGRTIMHCHILEHEDQGAMGWMNVADGGEGAPTFPRDTRRTFAAHYRLDGLCVAGEECGYFGELVQEDSSVVAAIAALNQGRVTLKFNILTLPVGTGFDGRNLPGECPESLKAIELAVEKFASYGKWTSRLSWLECVNFTYSAAPDAEDQSIVNGNVITTALALTADKCILGMEVLNEMLAARCSFVWGHFVCASMLMGSHDLGPHDCHWLEIKQYMYQIGVLHNRCLLIPY